VGGTTTTESYLYAYIASGTNAGKIDTITERRQIGAGSWTTVRTVTYTYHDGSTSNGTTGDVKTATVKDAAGNTLSTSYARYYTSSSSTGYTGGLKYSVVGDAYERFKAWCDANLTTPDTATDAQVAPFADYFEYDGLRRVTKHTSVGNGWTAGSSGLQTTTFAYFTSTFADGYNSWQVKTVATQADGNTLTTYTNFAGQWVLEV